MSKEITYTVGRSKEDNMVHIQFSEPIEAISFSPSQALRFSNLVREHVKRL